MVILMKILVIMPIFLVMPMIFFSLTDLDIDLITYDESKIGNEEMVFSGTFSFHNNA